MILISIFPAVCVSVCCCCHAISIILSLFNVLACRSFTRLKSIPTHSPPHPSPNRCFCFIHFASFICFPPACLPGLNTTQLNNPEGPPIFLCSSWHTSSLTSSYVNILIHYTRLLLHDPVSWVAWTPGLLYDMWIINGCGIAGYWHGRRFATFVLIIMWS